MIPLSPPTSQSMHSTCNHVAHRWTRRNLRNQRLALELRDTELSNVEIVLAAHRDLLPKGNVKHDAMSKSLLKEGMLAYHIIAAITACIIIIDMANPLTRANRLAAMSESDERITPIFTPFLRGPLRFTYALVDIKTVEGLSNGSKRRM